MTAKRTLLVGTIGVHFTFGEDGEVLSSEISAETCGPQSSGTVEIVGKVADTAREKLFELMAPYLPKPEATAHAATCAERGDAATCGCWSSAIATEAVASPSADAVPAPALDPDAIWQTAREIVMAHGGSMAATVRDLITAQEQLREAVTSAAGQPQR